LPDPSPELFFNAGHGIFPHPGVAGDNGLLAISEALCADDILLAYRFGIFPWNNPGEPIVWWAPDPRWIIIPEDINIHKSMRSLLNGSRLELRVDTHFEAVLDGCSGAGSGTRSETWIEDRIRSAYGELFDRGHAHSFEVWEDGKIVAGFYGVNIGDVFVGESMFTRISNGSKYALIKACSFFNYLGIRIVDCQLHSEHVERMGAIPVSRQDYLTFLRRRGFIRIELVGKWTQLLQHFQNKSG